MSPSPATPLSIIRALLLTMGWPAAAACSLAVAVGREAPSVAGLVLLACGTATAYGLDRWVDRRAVDAPGLRRMLVIVCLLAALCGGVLATTAWWRFQVCVVLGVLSGAYVPLKRYIPKNVLTTVAWTVAASTLPFDAPPDLHHAYWGSVLSVFCIMAANTMLCDIPDVAADRAAGVRGITVRFGPRAGAIGVVLWGSLGVIAGAVTGHLALAVTAGLLIPLGLALGRNPAWTRARMLADLAVTVIPGPLALLLG
jgi:4-hydroxybenzoate polyprenyltransferase